MPTSTNCNQDNHDPMICDGDGSDEHHNSGVIWPNNNGGNRRTVLKIEVVM